MAKAFRFLFPYASYSMVNDLTETHTRKELYYEYSRMREEANKRLERLGKSAYRKTQIYLKHKEGFAGGSRMNKAQLARAMSDVSKFLASKASTVEGAREIKRKAIETWRNEWGFDWINWRNYDEFADFLDKALGSRSDPYAIDDVSRLFRSAKKQRMDITEVAINFKEYKKQLTDDEDLVKLQRVGDEASSSKKIRNQAAGKKKSRKGKKGTKGRK